MIGRKKKDPVQHHCSRCEALLSELRRQAQVLRDPNSSMAEQGNALKELERLLGQA